MNRLNLNSICTLLGAVALLAMSTLAQAETGNDQTSTARISERTSNDPGWTLQLPADEKVVFKGVLDFDASGPSGASMLYPAPNAGGFLIGLITHAIILESMKGKRKTAAQEAADKVLVPYQDVVQAYTYRELMQRVLDKRVFAGPVKLVAHSENNETPWLIQSVPIFSLTQDETALVLDNVISISRPGLPVYLNTIKVVSTAAADANPVQYWTANQGEQLKRETAAMVADSLQIALRSVAGSLDTANTTYKTMRYFEGRTEKMERALLLSEYCNRVLIKTLRGWLMSIPVSRSEPNPALCSGASATLH